MRLINRTLDGIEPPIGSLERYLPDRLDERPLLDVSQGAPGYPTAPEVIERIRAVAADPDGGRYTPPVGLPALREAVAADLSAGYEAPLEAQDVLVTAGGNQAFCTTVSALTAAGDNVVMSVPYYFNHDMWIHLDQLEARYVPTGDDMVVRAADVEAAIDDRTRVIALVSPANPTGAEMSPELIAALADIARDRGIVLMLDETYRVFRDAPGPPHDLFSRSDWREYFVSLHSYSKDLAIPGYRVGAAIGAPQLLSQALKLMDCMAICAPRVGQEAVIAGLTEAGDWRRARALEVIGKRRRFSDMMADEPGGFRLRSAGAFYGWVEPPAGIGDSAEVARRLVVEAGIMPLPGTAFAPEDPGCLRFSYANLTDGEIDELGSRLRAFG